jgi:hypothetical protein
MAEQQQKQSQPASQQEQPDTRSDDAKQAQADSRSYEQKHQRYLDDLARLHDEP